MRILVIGSGGREHALVWKIRQSPLCTDLIVTPGNGGTQLDGVRSADVKPDDILGLLKLAREEKVDLVVPGPELPLVLGITDAMNVAGIPCFGPDRYCAQLEGSKYFAKDLMKKAGVPTAECAVFNDAESAHAFVAHRGAPLVIKADGLAAGKGVVVARTTEEALQAVDAIMKDHVFGDAGRQVVIEECLEGEEVSLLCLCDGLSAVPLPSAQDHKAAYDGDKGPNTGGMGAYTEAFAAGRSGLSFISDADYGFAVTKILQPVADAMADAGTPLTGVLYGGLMKTPDGIKVIEFNARFGDPETEVVLPRLETDIYDVFEAVACGGPIPQLHWKDESVLGVVLASNGYPGSYAKGAPIDIAPGYAERVYHMGTKRADDGRLQTAGGRVLMAVASAPSTPEAARRCYAAVGQIRCDNLFYRRDIAKFVL